MADRLFTYIPYISYGVAFLLVAVGLFLTFYKPRTREQIHIAQKIVLHNNMSLRDKLDIINGKNAFGSNAVKNYFFDVKLTLAKMNRINDYPKIRLAAFALAVIMFIVCLALDNLFLVFILVPLAFMIPFTLVKVKYRNYVKNLEKELETTLSLITISYTRTSNFITSVEECIDTLPPIAKPYFEDFLIEVKSINASIPSALLNLKTKVENKTFQQWIDRVMICQNDRTSIPSLQTYVNEFADNRVIQNELDAEIYSSKIEMYMMVGFVVFTPVLLYFMQKDAFNQLMTNPIGKFVVALSVGLVVLVLLLGNKIAKPVKFRGNKD
ncbi:MAG: type II secretion system F family protein [Candidatus Gastranaerophilaceae bacterium]